MTEFRQTAYPFSGVYAEVLHEGALVGHVVATDDGYDYRRDGDCVSCVHASSPSELLKLVRIVEIGKHF